MGDALILSILPILLTVPEGVGRRSDCFRSWEEFIPRPLLRPLSLTRGRREKSDLGQRGVSMVYTGRRRVWDEREKAGRSRGINGCHAGFGQALRV